MAVGDHDVGPAVAVEVRQGAAPADPGEAVDGQAEVGGDVEEGAPAQVPEEGVVFLLEVGDEQLRPAVAIEVLGVHPHPGRCPAADIPAGARVLRGVAEVAVTSVEEEEVRVLIVGDVDVNPAIAVQVGRHDAEAMAVGPADAGRDGDIGECPIPIVAIEDVPDGSQLLRGAVAADLAGGIAAEAVVAGPLPVAVPADVEVEVAVVVEIEEGRARRPGGGLRHAGGIG